MEIKDLYQIYLDCGCNVTTDSRSIKGGELFFALKGENFDGNLFAGKALDLGAAYAVVDSRSDAAKSRDGRIIPVDDTLKALQQLANHHRNALQPEGSRLTVIGLTGTNGKTTTKELIRTVLAAKYKVTATEGNLNNDIGVPLTLLKLRQDSQLAIVEMGANHPDDIAHLVVVCEPDLGLITNVGKAHLLGFGSFDGVKRAKGQLYDFIAAHGGEIFLNTDDKDLQEMAEARQGLSILPYGLEYDHATVLPSTPEEPFLRIRLGHRIVKTNLVGAYNAANVMAALAVGARFAVPVDDAVKAIAAFVPANNRSQMSRTQDNTLIIDAYNANPSSMNAALDNFKFMEADCKVALLGDMRELGEESVSEHKAIVLKAVGSGCKAIFVGDEFRKAIEELSQESAISEKPEWYGNSAQLASRISEHPFKGATILVKGSRGIKMETVLPVL